MYKALIGTLALCAISACADNVEPIAESGDSTVVGWNFGSFFCRALADSDRANNVRANLDFLAKTRPNVSQTQPDFDISNPRGYKRGEALDQADVGYYTLEPDPDQPGSNNKRNVFEHKNIEFEYDNEDLVLKIPQDNNLPACQIRFKKDDEIGEHTCESENKELGYRAATFDFTCGRAGKIGVIFPESDL